MEVIPQFVSLYLELSKFVPQLLDLADLALHSLMLLISLPLVPSIELELLSPDIFLSQRRTTFLLMSSWMRFTFFCSLSLITLMSGFGKSSDFLGRGGITVF